MSKRPYFREADSGLENSTPRTPYKQSASEELFERTFILCECCRGERDLRRVTLSVGSLTKFYANLCAACITALESRFAMEAAFMRRVRVDWAEVHAT